MGRAISILIIIFCTTVTLLAQKEANNWYFGTKAGVSFNQEPPVALLDSRINTIEGSASISDDNGSLLFYTDGITVWNKNHDTMINGYGLHGDNSSVHSALIVKKPNSSRYYYVFTSDQPKSYASPSYGINYSVIDIKKNLGKGEVISKNNQLLDNSTERLAATYHSNNKDIWVVTMNNNEDSLYTFLVSEKGLENNIAIQKTNITINSGESNLSRSQIKFSTDGKKLTFSTLNFNISPHTAYLVKVYVFDFDNKSGKISNKKELLHINKNLNSPFIDAYGLEFSPNSEILYMTLNEKGIYQCPIKTIKNDNLLDTTCFKINGNSTKTYYSLQLAPNGKIYAASSGNTLAAINYPDSVGNSCFFDSAKINLRSGWCNSGLPSMVYPNIYSSYLCLGDSTLIKKTLSSADSIKWQLGDGAQTTTTQTFIKYKYQDTGEYTVTAITYKGGKADTLNHTLHIYTMPKLDLGNDTLLCTGDSIAFNLSHPDIENYLWSTGDTLPTKILKSAGTYAVEISNTGCKSSDTINIKQLANCQISSAKFCYGDDTELSITNTNADSITWNFGDGIFQTTTNDSFIHKYQDSGTYTVTAKQYLEGLSANITKQITITRVDKPNLGNDTIICKGKNLQINYPPLFDNYTWNDGTNTPVKAITKEGLYWMEVEKNGCKGRDSIEVLFFDCDFTISNKCLGDTTEIKLAGNNQDSVKWELGDNTSQTTVSSQTKYRYTTKGSYTATARVYIGKLHIILSENFEVIEFPKSNLPKDTGVCENQTVNANISSPTASIFWNNGSNLSVITPNQSGQYILTLTEGECITKDTINISILECGCDLYFPNAYSPDNNNLNELFYPTTECPLKQYKLQIFSRWGALIFESQDMKHGWDGTYKSLPVPNGAYIWVATYQSFITGKKYSQKGSVTLLR